MKKEKKAAVFSSDDHKRKMVDMSTKNLIALTVHQLDKPLSAIKLSLEMLLDGSFGEMREEQKDVIAKTYQKSKMMIELIGNLLNIEKIEENRYAHNTTLVNFEDLIESVISFEREELESKKIKFKFEKPAIKLPKIILNKEKMIIAIQNIFDNAVKYTPMNGKITIFLRGDDKEIKLTIQDSGIGIPESQQEKLFTKFFRASNAEKANNAGFGLGLFVARNIIEENNGKIWFESKENKGSSFFVSLPVGS